MDSWVSSITGKLRFGYLSEFTGGDILPIGAAVVAVGVGAWIWQQVREKERRKGKGHVVSIGYSHFCELAKWALDKPAHGVPIPYYESSYPFGVHRQYLPKYRQGLQGSPTSVPTFIDADGTKYGSTCDILEFAGWKFSDFEMKHLTLELLGSASRRIAYYYALLGAPQIIRGMNVDAAASWRHAAQFNILWYWNNFPEQLKSYLKVDKNYDPANDVVIIDGILQQVEKRLANAEFLGAGGNFGAEDMAFAALGALALWPDCIPYANGAFHKFPLSMLPKEYVTIVKQWRNTVGGRHAFKVYNMYRTA